MQQIIHTSNECVSGEKFLRCHPDGEPVQILLLFPPLAQLFIAPCLLKIGDAGGLELLRKNSKPLSKPPLFHFPIQKYAPGLKANQKQAPSLLEKAQKVVRFSKKKIKEGNVGRFTGDLQQNAVFSQKQIYHCYTVSIWCLDTKGRQWYSGREVVQ